MCFTDDQRHNHIRMFLSKVLELVKKQTQVKKIIQWSDNCAGQYKSHKAFTNISKSTILTEHHFFGAQHGKGPADAFISRLKQQIHMGTLASEVDIEWAWDVYTYAQKNWEKEGKCIHAQTHFVYTHPIAQSDSKKPCKMATVPGTLKLHCVKSTGVPYQIEVQDFSCFCTFCR